MSSSANPTLSTTPVKPSYLGKQPEWMDIDNMAAVMSIVHLPDTAINGTKKRKADWHDQIKQ